MIENNLGEFISAFGENKRDSFTTKEVKNLLFYFNTSVLPNKYSII